MKTVEVHRDFDYRPTPQWGVRFLAGYTYRRVLEAATAAIVRAGAGRVVPSPNNDGDGAAGLVDAFPVFDVRKRRRRK
jgi:hypothetical protein